jgi:Spy/CpxP family protein refolding chaperone
MVMRNQKAIGLTADQQTSIRGEMQKALPQFTELQWQQSAEEEAMQELAKVDHPDEAKILAQLDKLTTIENTMKRTQLSLMVRIKNLLTPEQQQKLRALEKETRGRQGSGGGRPAPGGPPGGGDQ